MAFSAELNNPQKEQAGITRRQFLFHPIGEVKQIYAINQSLHKSEQKLKKSATDVFTRRQIGKLSLQALGAAAFLEACGGTTNVDFAALYERGEVRPNEGVVFNYGNQYVLVRGGKPHLIEDFETYRKGVLFDSHGRTLLKGPPPKGLGDPIVHEEATVITTATNEIKENSRNKIMPIYVTGVLDTKSLRNPEELSDKTIAKVIADQKKGEGDNGNTVVDAAGTFIDLMNRLNKRGVGYDNSLRLMYGKTGENSYSIFDTLSDPGQHIKDMGLQMDNYVNEFPLSQFVMIGYSLGGLYALMAAMQHPDAVNDIVLIESPIMGLPKDDPKVVVARQTLHDITNGKSDPVIDYLCGLHDNTTYQNAVYDFVADFTKDGKKTITYVTVDTDLIVPREFSYVPSRGNGKQNFGREMRFKDLKIQGGIIGSHGPGLWQSSALDLEVSLFGFDHP